MIPYLIFFSISIIFSILTQISSNKNNKTGVYIFASLSIGSLSLLGGLRDLAVGGPDFLYVYGNQRWNYAVNSSSFKELLTFSPAANEEPAYLLINYIISRFTSSPNWFVLVIGLIINLLFFIGIYNFRTYASIPIAWLGYCTMIFVPTLNIIRQSLVLGLAFWLYSLILVKGKKPVILLLMLPLFHSSGIIGTIIGFFFIIILKMKNVEKGMYYALIGSLIFVVFSAQIIPLLVNLGLISSRFSAYLNQSSNEEGVLGLTNLYRIPLLLVMMAYYKKYIKGNKILTALYIAVLLDFIFIPLRLINETISRAVYYFSYLRIVAYSGLINRIRAVDMKIALNISLVIYFVLFFVLSYIQNPDFEYAYYNLSFLESLSGLFS